MTGDARHAPIPVRTASLALALATALLGGCADIHRALETSQVNPESPVAAQVAAGARLNHPTPWLRDVPPVPKNLPAASEVKIQIGALVVCRRAMAGYVVDHPPLSGQAAAFATDERDIVGIGPNDVPPPDSAAKAEAYAAQLRSEAAPPPAIASGPPPTPSQGMPPAPGAPTPAAKPAKIARATTPPPPTATPSAPAPAPVAVVPAQVAATAMPPPLPPPLPDPLLTRCS